MAGRPDRGFNFAKSAEDCKEPVCDDAKEFTNVAKMFTKSSSGGPNKPNPNAKPAHCPLNKAQLGRNTWSFLHTTAAYYPEKPTPEDKTEMVHFIRSFSRFYPCRNCAEDFRDDLQYFPPKEHVNSRQNLAQYFCMLHNRVNTKLGKEEFDCSYDNLKSRWYKNTKGEC